MRGRRRRAAALCAPHTTDDRPHFPLFSFGPRVDALALSLSFSRSLALSLSFSRSLALSLAFGVQLPVLSLLPPSPRTHALLPTAQTSHDASRVRRPNAHPTSTATAELNNFPEGEVEEMVQLYTKKGLPEHSARTVINTLATVPNFFVDVMMLEELQMAPPPPMSAGAAAVRIGVATLVCGSSLPLGAALLTRHLERESAHLATLAIAATALCYVGSMRATITHQDKRRLALQTLALGVPCVLFASLAGKALREAQV